MVDKLRDVMSLGRVSELAKARLSGLEHEIEQMEEDVDDLIYEAKWVRSEMEIQYACEISKLHYIREAQVCN